MLESLFNKGLKSWNVIKETPTQVFSGTYCEIFKKSFFVKYLWLLLSLCIFADLKKDIFSVSKFLFNVDFNPNLSGFFNGSFCGRGDGGKITPCLKPVRIMLETWNLIRKCIHIWRLKIYLLVPSPTQFC